MPNDTFSSPDELIRFLFSDINIRGEITQLSESYKAVLSQQDYPESIQHLIGEFMAASALLSATIKSEGNLILQLKTSGQLQLLMAECRQKSLLRAIARFDETTSEEVLGNGQLAITIEPDAGERYQGIVEYAGNSLSQALEKYFQQSEQLNTRLWLAGDGNVAAGMLIQEIPENPDFDNISRDEDAWNRVNLLASTVENQELTNLGKHQLLHRLFHEETVRVFDPQPLKFECTCSRQRTESVLRNLGQEEVRTLLVEQGVIGIDCQFCHNKYEFNSDDVAELFRASTH